MYCCSGATIPLLSSISRNPPSPTILARASDCCDWSIPRYEQVRWEKAARVAQRRDRDNDFIGYTYKRRVNKPNRGGLGGDLFAAPLPEEAQTGGRGHGHS